LYSGILLTDLICKHNFNQVLYKNIFTGKKEETRKKKVNPLFDREFFKIRRVWIVKYISHCLYIRTSGSCKKSKQLINKIRDT
jgi:hypothetical protein